MLIPVRTAQFKRDVKLGIKRGKKTSILRDIMEKLAKEEKLDAKYRDHKLTGKYNNSRECHLEPN